MLPLRRLIFGLIFVLGIAFPPDWSGYGFKACPIVTTCVVDVQFLFIWYVYVHKQRLHEPCWDGWNYKEIRWALIRTFSGLYFRRPLGWHLTFGVPHSLGPWQRS
jgi:hypothetical protein